MSDNRITRRDLLKMLAATSIVGAISSPFGLITRALPYNNNKNNNWTSNKISNQLDPNKINVINLGLESFLKLHSKYEIGVYSGGFYCLTRIKVKVTTDSKMINSVGSIVYVPLNNKELIDMIAIKPDKLGELDLSMVLSSNFQYKYTYDYDNDRLKGCYPNDRVPSAFENGCFNSALFASGTSVRGLDNILETSLGIAAFDTLIQRMSSDKEYLEKTDKILSIELKEYLPEILSILASGVISATSFYKLMKEDNGILSLLYLSLSFGVPFGEALYLLERLPNKPKEHIEKIKVKGLLNDTLFNKYPDPLRIGVIYSSPNTFMKALPQIYNNYATKHLTDESFKENLKNNLAKLMKNWGVLVDPGRRIDELVSILLLKTFGGNYAIDIPYFRLMYELYRSNELFKKKESWLFPRLIDINGTVMDDLGYTNLMIFTRETYNKFAELVETIESYNISDITLKKYNIF